MKRSVGKFNLLRNNRYIGGKQLRGDWWLWESNRLINLPERTKGRSGYEETSCGQKRPQRLASKTNPEKVRLGSDQGAIDVLGQS